MAGERIAKIARGAGFSLPDVRGAVFLLSRITGSRVTTDKTVEAYAEVARYVGARSLSQFIQQVTDSSR